ncbi:hypothetical protein ACFWVP_18560 [Streptomyces sp. NPDC058637]|uniref:hypothetical protein n=1 Tax=Streptomyces sp. NPDC058637 TaxID=3346569 RepID=UPI003658FDC2
MTDTWFGRGAVLAVALLAVAAALWAPLHEHRARRHRRLGYRVGLDSAVAASGPTGIGHLFAPSHVSGDQTLVHLRIANEGHRSIARGDYTGRDLHGLAAEFTDRFVRGVSVVPSPGAESLTEHITPAAGLRYEGGTLCLPRVPLAPGHHFDLLVLLSGGQAGGGVRVLGGIRDGEVRPTPELPFPGPAPVSSRAARRLTVLLTACVLALASVVVVDGAGPASLWPVLAVIGGTSVTTALLALRGAGAPPTRSSARFQDLDARERTAERRQIVLLLGASLIGYGVAFLAGRSLLGQPDPPGFEPSETVQLIAAVSGLLSATALGVAGIIKAIGYLTYARADMVRARAALPPPAAGPEPDPAAEAPPGLAPTEPPA